MQKSVKIFIGFWLLLGLYLISLYSYPLSHSITEIFSVVVAAGIFMLAWTSRKHLDNNYLLFIGIAHLFVGGMDFLHVLSYSGMEIFKGYDANLPTQLWISARYMQSISILLGLFFIEKKFPADRILYVFSAVMGVTLLLIFKGVFPDYYIEGEGLTRFKINSEYVITAILVASAGMLYKNKGRFDSGVYRLLQASIISSVLAEIALTFYISVYGISDLFGHLFKLLSFSLIYTAIVERGLSRPYSLLLNNLKASEKQYKAVIKTSIDGFWIVDSGGRFLDVNDAYCRLIGYSREELLGMGVLDVEAVESPEQTAEHLKTIIETGSDRFETKHRRKDGTVIDIEISTNYLPAEGGRFFVFVRDITQRKQHEEQLRDSKELLETVFSSTDILLAYLDRDFNFISVNEAYAKAARKGREYFAGRNHFDLYPHEENKAIFLKVVQTGETVFFKAKPFEHPDQPERGTTYWNWSLVPVKDSLGEVSGLVFSLNDVTEHKLYEAVLKTSKEDLELQVRERTAQLDDNLMELLSQIEEKKQAETALKESEERLRRISEATFEGIAILQGGTIIDANRQFAEMLGYTETEVIGLSVKELVAPESQALVLNKIKSRYKESYEHVALKKDGTRFYVEVKGKDVVYQGRKVRETVVRDITERKCREETLRTHAAIFDNLSEGIYLIGFDDLTIKWVNPVFEKMFGYETGEMIGKHIDIVNAPTDMTPEQTRAAIVDILAESGQWHGEVENIKKDGTCFWCFANFSLFDHPKFGKVIVSVHTDITERKKAEEEFSESEERYRNLVETSQDLIFRCDSQGRFTYLNPAWEKTLGYKPDEMLGHSFAEFKTPDIAEHDKETFKKILEGSDIFGYETVYTSKSGTHINLVFNAKLLRDAEGTLIGTQGTAYDITEREKAEQEIAKINDMLREERGKFSAIADYTYDWENWHSPEGRIIWTNPAVQRIAGYTVEECFLSVECTLPFVYEEDCENVCGALKQAIKDRTSINDLSFRIQRKDGEALWAAVSWQPIYGKDGAYLGIRSSIRDISKRKNYEDELMEKAAFVMNNPAPVIQVDSGGFVVQCNHAMSNLFGVELAGGQLSEFFPETLDMDLSAIPYETPLQFEDIVGDEHFLFTVIRDMVSNSCYIFGSNITEIRLAEHALKESEEKYRDLTGQFNTLLDAIPDEIMLIGRDRKVLWANQAVKNRYGDATAPNPYCYTLRFNRDVFCDDCPVLRSFESKQEENLQAATDERMLDIRAFPIIREDGSVSKVIEVVSDITEKIKLQQETFRSKQMASMGEMAAGVAHEINNPINGIISYAQLIELDLSEGDPMYDICERIVKEGERVADIVRSLLSFSRDSKGQKTPCSVEDIVADTVLLVQSMFKRDGISIEVNKKPDLPEILASPNEIRQVFLNLMTNSRNALNVKFDKADKEKKITIDIDTVEAEDCKYISVIVTDFGVGIPVQNLERIFNPFFTTSLSAGGSGLGLSISHGIIKNHGGTIEVDSKEGQYTKVLLMFPTGV